MGHTLRPFWQRPVVVFMGCLSLGVGLIRFFHFVLLERLTPLGLVALWLLAAGLGVLGLGWLLIIGLRSLFLTSQPVTTDLSRQPRPWQWLGLLVLPVLALTLPGEKVWLWLNFHRYQAERQQVVQLIQTGEIAANAGMVPLPDAYRGTSLGGGEVQVLYPDGSLAVLFFTLRVYEGAAGFLYSPHSAPLPEAAISGYTLLEQRSLGDGWYYVRIGS